MGAFAAGEFKSKEGDAVVPRGAAHPDLLKQSLNLLTFCVLVLQNGFTVTGESACASPENFDADLGRKIARDNAVQKLWPLMGYALKQQVHEYSDLPSAFDAAHDRYIELGKKLASAARPPAE